MSCRTREPTVWQLPIGSRFLPMQNFSHHISDEKNKCLHARTPICYTKEISSEGVWNRQAASQFGITRRGRVRLCLNTLSVSSTGQRDYPRQETSTTGKLQGIIIQCLPWTKLFKMYYYSLSLCLSCWARIMSYLPRL